MKEKIIVLGICVVILFHILSKKDTMRAIAEREYRRLRFHSRALEHFHREYQTGFSHDPRPDGRIFVSIASYRDPELVPTVKDLLTKASRPANLTVAICIQDEPSVLENLERVLRNLCESKGALPKVMSMSFRDAKGPCWARYLLQHNVWAGEEYYLQLDSHMRFAIDWDTKAITCLKRCRSRLPCLTNYVSRYNLRTGEPETMYPLRGPLRVVNIDPSDGFFRIKSSPVKSMPDGPAKAVMWAACFSFSSSRLILDAPYDPYTPFLFFGEETDIAARLYTRGWDFFAPDVPICFTSFVRAYRRTFWENPYQRITEPLSRMRLYKRMGLLQYPLPSLLMKKAGSYALGKERSWKEFVGQALIKQL